METSSYEEEWRSVKYYHAHVYFEADQPSHERALKLKEDIAVAFPSLRLGTPHNTPSGPHTVGNYEVLVTREALTDFVLWLGFHKHPDTSVLLHPVTAHQYQDHTQRPLWVGPQIPIKLDLLKQRDEQHAKEGKSDEAVIAEILHL